MVANKNSPLQKCGDLFINIKTFKNKSRIFTFQCSLCSMDFDQLKKFSIHLEDHLEYFQHQFGNITVNQFFETEKIQLKSKLVEQINNVDESGVLSGHESLLGNVDPLETEPLYTIETAATRKTNNAERILNEKVNCNKMATNENMNAVQVTETVGVTKQTEIETNSLVFDDLSSVDSCESEFDLELDSKTEKTNKKLKDSKYGNCNKPKKRRRVIIQSILPFLIQQYKKYETLWQINDIAFGIKMKKYETFTQIAETLKLEKHKMISLEDLNYHINYLNELYSKDKEQELKCKMNKVEFVAEYEHYKDMSFLSQSQGPFLCSICNEILPRYHSFCQHTAEHKESQPYKCPLCESAFINYHKYLVHKKRHLGILDFYCKICGKGYMFKNDLEWHMTSHTGDKPYLCPICGTGFRARHGYDNHVRRHEERFRHECHICKRGFNQLHALNSHVKSHLNIRDVLCKICGKGFVHSKYLKRHELIHGKEKHYKCNECGKEFFQPCGLRAHRKNHHS